MQVASGEGRGDYVLFIGCLIPLVAGVPIFLGVLPPAFSMSVVSIFSGASPPLVASGHWAHWVLPHFYPPLYCHRVVRGYLSYAGTPQGLPSQSGLSLFHWSLHGWCRRSRGHFVEMCDLLGNNIALPQHFESAASYFPTVLPPSERPRLLEVSSLSL